MPAENGLAATVTVTDDVAQEQRFDLAQAMIKEIVPTDLPWQDGGRQVCANQIRSCGANIVMESIEQGRWLIYARQHLDADEFRSFVEDDIGIHIRTAKRNMQLASRVADKRFAAKITSVHKLVALLGFDDQQLESLDDSGDIMGLSVEAINETPVIQLRKQVAQLQGKVAKGKDQLKRRDEKIESLEEDIERLSSANGREIDHPFYPASEHLFGAINDFEFALTSEAPVSPEEIAQAYLCASKMLAAVKERCDIDLSASLPHAGEEA